MKTKNEKSNELSSVFLELGCQYYAIARYCTSVFYMPICATMFHHAIEMLIKGYLVRTFSSRDLQKIGHNLLILWSLFKETTNDKSLVRFDKAITDLNRVETLRYPDAMVNEGFILNVRYGVTSPSQFPGFNKKTQYYINVSDLDDIAIAIFVNCNVNPKLGFKNTPTEFLTSLPPDLKPIG